jgi:CheY-like chemotaxis protein
MTVENNYETQLITMKPIHILLVEDNEGDMLLTIEALEEGKIMNKISTVKNGKDAIDFVTRKGNFANANSPDLILLDINLPMKNGHEVLKFIKDSDNLKHIPVVMFTTSSSQKDIVEAYKHHASCFITKPVEVNEFMEVVSKIEDFWSNIVNLPVNAN